MWTSGASSGGPRQAGHWLCGALPVPALPDPPLPPATGTSPSSFSSAAAVWTAISRHRETRQTPTSLILLAKCAHRARRLFIQREVRARRASRRRRCDYRKHAPGIFFGGFTTGLDIFGIAISQADGTALKALSQPTATWTDVMIDVPNPTAGRVSAFTLYGLSAELDTKPDIGAPGGFVRSTIPLEMGGYGTNSGTSMASPHVTRRGRAAA